MMRLAILFTVMAAPAFAQSAPIDPIEDRPGRWISMRPAEPATSAPLVASDPAEDLLRLIAEPPDASEVLAPLDPLPPATPSEVERLLVLPDAAPLLPLPEAAPVLDATQFESALITPRAAVPQTRPIPNPRHAEMANTPEAEDDPVASTTALFVTPPAAPVPVPLESAVAEALSRDLPPDEAADATVAAALPAPAAPDLSNTRGPVDGTAEAALPEVAAVAMDDGGAAEAYDPAAIAARLAEDLAEDARDIVLAGPRDIPQSPSDVGELLPPVVTEAGFAMPNLSVITPPADVVEPRSTTPSDMLDEVAGDLMAEAIVPSTQGPLVSDEVRAPSFVDVAERALRLPAATQSVARHTAVPVLMRLGLEDAPLVAMQPLPAPHVLVSVGAMSQPSLGGSPSHQLPQRSLASPRVADLAAGEAPVIDALPQVFPTHESSSDVPFALVVLEAPDLPLLQPRLAAYLPEANLHPQRVAALGVLATPGLTAAPLRPDPARAWPAPDAGAVARLIEDTEICWRLADLSVEARWSDVYIDVAFDAWNMPSALSVRLAQQMDDPSEAVQEAFRAAQAALAGCAMASDRSAATLATTLLFDRHGVHLR